MPGAREVGAWLERLFGEERVALKRAIARGADVERALARLAALAGSPARSDSHPGGDRPPSLVEPRTLWSNSLGNRPSSDTSKRAIPRAPLSGSSGSLPRLTVGTTSSSSLPRLPASRRQPVVVIVGLVLAAGGVLAAISLRPTTARVATADAVPTGTLTVRSRPAGAHILIDGNPSGLVTPATLPGLKVGRSLELRLDKPGYTTVSRRVQIQAGTASEELELVEASGTLHFTNLPANASIFIDDNPVEGGSPVAVAIGPHRVRVETPGDVLFTADMEIQRGEQTVRLAPSRKGPNGP
jgi:hypothetical protein